MNRSVPRRLGWRIAVAAASVAALLAAPSFAGAASADDLPFTTTPTLFVGNPVAADQADGDVASSAWSPRPTAVDCQWYFNDVAIAGATRPQYNVPAGDIGGNLRFDETASRPGYASTTVSSGEFQVIGQLVPGTMSFSAGPFVAGQPITVNPGNWIPADTTFTFHWSGTGVPGDTSDTYTPNDSNIHGVSVTVTGHHDGYFDYDVQLDTGPITPDVFIPAVPTISGSPYKWSTLSANTRATSWNPVPSSFSYQWNRNGNPISGATADTYTVGPADFEHRISLTVTAMRAGYAPVSSTSASETITSGYLKLPRLKVRGVAGIGHKLIADFNDVELPDNMTFVYMWYLDGVPATDSDPDLDTYIPDSNADIGKRVTVAIQGFRGDLPQQDAQPSVPTAPIVIGSGTLHPGVASILPIVGVQTAVEYIGPVSTTNPASYAWYLDGALISTVQSYQPTVAEWHHELSASITVHTDFGDVITMTRPALVTTGVFRGHPTISGTPEAKRVLSIDESTLVPTPATTKVTWYEGSSLEHSHTKIGTGATFLVEPGLVGEQVFAVLTITAKTVFTDRIVTPPVTIAATPGEQLLPTRF